MENKVKEIWKTIPNFEKDTEVSNLGNVRRIDSKTGEYIKRSIHKDKDGYLKIVLYDGSRKTIPIHRVILMTWDPVEDMEKLQVNHKDENKKNNCLDNLEWMTCKENINYGTGIQRGHKRLCNKVRCIETGQIFESQKDVAEYLGHKSMSNISQHLKGVQKTCGEYHWERIEVNEYE